MGLQLSKVSRDTLDTGRQSKKSTNTDAAMLSRVLSGQSAAPSRTVSHHAASETGFLFVFDEFFKDRRLL